MEVQVQRIPRQVDVHTVVGFDGNRPGSGLSDTLHFDVLARNRDLQVLRAAEHGIANYLVALDAVGPQAGLVVNGVLELLAGKTDRYVPFQEIMV